MDTTESNVDAMLIPEDRKLSRTVYRRTIIAVAVVAVTVIIAVIIWAIVRSTISTSSTPTAETVPVPTRAPSVTPSVTPSASPSASPSGPTHAPTASPSLSPISSPTSLSLDATQLINFATASSWNITKISHGTNSSLHQLAVDPVTNTGNVLKVNYPIGSYKPSALPVGGIGVYASPPSIFPARSVRFSYEVYFAPNFNPMKGGKLPGLYIGPPGANGGQHISNEASCRIMWRKDNSSGGIMTEAYVYLAATQDPSYSSIPNQVLDPIDGDSLWRGLVNYNRGSWNKVSMILTVNTVTGSTANADGVLDLTVNGVTETFSKFNWTASSSVITGVTFTTFFGGSDNTWATPVYTSTYFKGIQLQKLA